MPNFKQLSMLAIDASYLFTSEAMIRKQRNQLITEIMRELGGSIKFEEYRSFSVNSGLCWHDVESVALVDDIDHEIYFKVRGSDKMIDLNRVDSFETNILSDDKITNKYMWYEFLEFLSIYLDVVIRKHKEETEIKVEV